VRDAGLAVQAAARGEQCHELADIAADLPELAGTGYEGRLTDVLDPLRDQFDVILLDTPGGLSTSRRRCTSGWATTPPSPSPSG